MRLGMKCFWCDSIGPLTRDHVVPLGVGGSDWYDNIVRACGPCQRERGLFVSLFKEAQKLRREFHKERDPEKAVEQFERYCKAVWKQRHTQRKYRLLLFQWIRTEKARWGRSPTSEMDFSLPEVPAV